MAKTKRVKPMEAIAIEASSGNVFQDLGLPDAAERLAKAELARVVRHIIAGKQWTQRRAADELGIAPPDVSDLMRGKLARFSQERLERFLNALGMDVQIRVSPRAVGKKHANVTVEFVSA
ncbi:MAG: helix-turn-helix transcriptional regulator [Vicinamibacterales bacterium]